MASQHTIRIASDHEECQGFVAWLRQQGHDAAVSDGTGSYVDDAWTSESDAAADVLRRLWDEYCAAYPDEIVVALVGHDETALALRRGDDGQYRWTGGEGSTAEYATAEAAVNDLVATYAGAPLAWVEGVAAQVASVTAHVEDLRGYALARAYDAGRECARDYGCPARGYELWALDGLDVHDAAVTTEDEARTEWLQGLADETAWLVTSVWSPRGVIAALGGGRDYPDATDHATCRTCGRTFGARPATGGAMPTRCASCSGMTQERVAALLGVAQPSVSAWLSGQSEMSRQVRLLALAHLGVLPTADGGWRPA